MKVIKRMTLNVVRRMTTNVIRKMTVKMMKRQIMVSERVHFIGVHESMNLFSQQVMNLCSL